MLRLRPKDVKAFRDERRAAQGDTCSLCNVPFTDTDRVVLDHCHKTGVLRGSIHSNCNVLLGRVENAARRFGVPLKSFAQGLAAYLESDLGVLHPTHLTPDEKKAKAKARAKRKRANGTQT